MVTVRLGTFETNSSSCHAFTIINSSHWEDFKAQKIYIKVDNCAETKIHTTVIDDISKDNYDDYFISADEYINSVYNEVSDYFNNASSSYNRARYSSYSTSEFDSIVDSYIKKNLTVDLLRDILLKPAEDILFSLDKPYYEDYSRYYSDNKDHIVEHKAISVGDAFDRIFGYGRGRFEFIDVYIYGTSSWDPQNISLKEFVAKDTSEDILLIERKIQD